MKFLFAVSSVALIVLTSSSIAQDFPTRPITMVAPFAAGGGNDVLARLVAQPMSDILKQPVIIENVAGAGGMTGGNRVAKATPCLLYTSPSPRDRQKSRMPSSA